MVVRACRAVARGRSRVALVVAATAMVGAIGLVSPAGSPVAPVAAEAHPPCFSDSPVGDANGCVFAGLYATRKACRKHGRRALRADPYPNLDWEHYHCRQLNGPSNVWALNLYDLGHRG
jgi:hypothetical protein